MRSGNLCKQAIRIIAGKKNQKENGGVMLSGHQLFLILISILVCVSIISNSAAYRVPDQKILTQNNGELVITGSATVTYTPDPTANPTPDPTATPTPDPTATPTPDPTASPTPDPTATPSPDPTAVGS